MSITVINTVAVSENPSASFTLTVNERKAFISRSIDELVVEISPVTLLIEKLMFTSGK